MVKVKETVTKFQCLPFLACICERETSGPLWAFYCPLLCIFKELNTEVTFLMGPLIPLKWLFSFLYPFSLFDQLFQARFHWVSLCPLFSAFKVVYCSQSLLSSLSLEERTAIFFTFPLSILRNLRRKWKINLKICFQSQASHTGCHKAQWALLPPASTFPTQNFLPYRLNAAE